MSTKSINEALGLGDGGIDAFLSDLTVDNASFDQQFSKIDDKVKENVSEIDNQIAQYNAQGIAKVDVANLNSSLSEIKELITLSKGAIKHIYDSLVSSELVDSELAAALSKLMESSHLAIAEYIQLFKDRMTFYDKVRLEMLKFNQKKELMEMKHKLDMEKMEKKNEEGSIETKNMVSYSQEDITKMLNEVEKETDNY